MNNNLFPKNITPEGQSFINKSMAVGVVMFVLLVASVVAAFVLKMYFILIICGVVLVLFNIVAAFIMKSKLDSILEIELKKNYVNILPLNGRLKNIKKSDIASVKKSGKTYKIVLADGTKLKTVASPRLVQSKNGKDFFTKENFPKTELTV